MAAIRDSGRSQLAEVGPTALSLRAVARDLGMASSAVYRYVESRDELLTLLIIDAFNDLGTAAEQAESHVPREDFRGRWLAICNGVRDWAVAHPNEYALIYGSPVPGYAAPQDTVGPATRVPRLMMALLPSATVPAGQLPSPVEAALAPMLAGVATLTELPPEEFSPEALAAGLIAWTHLIGAVSFELFGHRTGVVSVEGRRDFFEFEMTRLASLLGLLPDSPAGPGS